MDISGSGFSGATAVDFGPRPASSYNILNDSTLTAVVPAGTPGNVDVTVTAGCSDTILSQKKR